jgi:hypothetical protein
VKRFWESWSVFNGVEKEQILMVHKYHVYVNERWLQIIQDLCYRTCLHKQTCEKKIFKTCYTLSLFSFSRLQSSLFPASSPLL